MADRLFGILRHEHLQLGLRPLMIQECLPGAAEQPGEFGPRIRRDPREFEALHAALIEEWSPSGPSEQSRVFGIADAECRKLRSRRFAEGKAISNSLRPDHPAFDEARGLIAFGYFLCRERLDARIARLRRELVEIKTAKQVLRRTSKDDKE